MVSLHRFAITTLIALAAESAASAQTPATIAEAAARGAAIVDAAVRAHGGVEALRAAQRIRVTLDGQDIWRNQSARVEPPYDARAAVHEVLVDLPASRVVIRQAGAYPGDLPFSTRRVSDGDRAHRVFEQSGVHRLDRAAPAAALSAGLFPYLPQLALLAAIENRATLRFLGKLRLSAGGTVDAVSMSTASGAVTLGFDSQTHQLRALLDAHADPLAGDASVETVFLDYRPLNNLLLPGRRVSYVAGERTQELRYIAATRDAAIPDSLLAIPSSSKPLVRTAGEAATELAPGVWDIRQSDTHVLAVVFSDYVVVVEAPAGMTRATQAQVAKVAPGKPIRFVVPTHHHDDHSGGIKEFVAAGTTVLTTPGNRAYFERMLSARSAIEGDTLSIPRRSSNIALLTAGRHVFTDGTRRLEIHDVGPNEHAKELLVAWIPDAGILYEADMITTAPSGDVVRGANMKALVSFAEQIRRRGWSVRTFAGTHRSPVTSAVLTEILAQPLK